MKKRLTPLVQDLHSLAPVMLALAALALLLFSRQTLETAQDQRDAARAALKNAATALADTEDMILRRQGVQAHLATVHEQGLDQPIDELRWHETLAKARQDLHMFALHYELTPERPAEHAADAPPSSLRVVSLRFEAVLRHEEDFLALLHRVEQVGTGVRTRRCRLTLTPEGDSPVRLDARCELERAFIQLGKGAAEPAGTGSDVPPPETGTPPRQDQER